jgi:hypothetical protein
LKFFSRASSFCCLQIISRAIFIVFVFCNRQALRIIMFSDNWQEFLRWTQCYVCSIFPQWTHVGCSNAWNSSCVIRLMSARTCNPLPW